MARFQGRVSRAHNRRHRYLGRLWQSRYRARVIDTTEYFRHAISYVHLNPVSAGIVDDPNDYLYSGHREIIGTCRPHVVNVPSVLRGFGGGNPDEAVEDCIRWVRSVAEARWAAAGIPDLPWWAEARHVDEIADPARHPEAMTFDCQRNAEERAEPDLTTLVSRFESESGYELEDLASSRRSARHLKGRIEFCMLGIPRYGLRACEMAAVLRKGRNSVTRWLNDGLRRARDEPELATRLDRLDSALSRR